ncbi:MAG TPA: NADH-quinone oxidoreductase subunit L [Anaerolineae bacterium]|nr:NADH-quinone oxidoreductase subunit L [Anaerolineae bacterium]
MSPATLELFTWLIPVPPLLAFFTILLLTRKNHTLSHTAAIGAIGISLVLAQIVFWTVLPGGGAHLAEDPIHSTYAWLPTGDTTFNVGVLVDPLTAIMLFMVPIACFLIIFYSTGYSNYHKQPDPHDHPGQPPHNGREPLYSRFFAFLSLFAGAMLTLVVADNLLLLFIGWEVMGLCSYLLIGFWYARNYDDPHQITPRQAAIKAFMTTRIGDVVMLIGIVALYNATGTLSFREIFTPDVTGRLGALPSLIIGIPLAQFIFFLLFVGTIGKSAQFPLHTWLPDAMEGPTPVSAMIHAAAMVSAGVYMVIRMFPLLAGTAHEGAPTFEAMTLIGAFTALMASTIALAQNDVKRVLAYSTISQLGYMIAALGIGAYVAAAFHLITHAFFKALLFLGSGSIIHGVEHGLHQSHEQIDPQNMLNMGGLRKKMPLTFWTFLVGGFSLAGFPLLTAGFWSKDEILADALTHAPVVFWVLALSAFLTAFYTMRQISLTFLGRPRTEAAAHAHESHWTMTLPLVILAVFALTAGFVGVKPDFPVLGPILRGGEAHGTAFEAFLAPTIENVVELEVPTFDWTPVAASVTVALGGLFVGWWVYGRKPLAAGQPDPLARLGGLHTFLKNKWYFDELYDRVFVRPSVALGVGVYRWIDRWLIDGILHAIGRGAYRLAEAFRAFDRVVINGGVDAFVEGIKAFGRWFREVQTGWVQQYLYVAVLGVLVLAALYLALLS